MRPVICFLLVGLLGAATSAGAEETPQAILHKAMQAQGGEGLLRQAHGEQIKVKGVLKEQMNIKGAARDIDEVTFTGDVLSQPPHQSKAVLHLEVGGVPLTMTQVHNGNKGWIREGDGASEPADKKTLIEMQQSGYVDYISTLVPLLDGKTFDISILSDANVQGRPAAGILIKSKGQPDVRLYFDHDTGLLIKTEYRSADARKKEVQREEYFSDYREVNPATADEELLKKAKIATDGPELLAYLRKRTLNDERRDKIDALIRQLGANAFDVRERAKQGIVAEGTIALPFLNKALRDPDPEIAGRAKECLNQIGKAPPDVDLAAAVVRLIAQRRPDGAVKSLLTYLPNAPGQTVVQEVQAALAAVAFQDGKADPALVQALEDKDPQRRTAAAAALGRDDSDREGRTERAFIRGLKHAMRGVEYRDGKKSMEWELTEVQYFKRLGNNNFAKP
jgi:hypothetical protein